MSYYYASKYGFNLRRCNSASSLSGLIERNKLKVIIALPTDPNIIQLFEKTLISGFCCINTRLAFDTEILLPHLSAKDLTKLTTDQSFKLQERHDLKVGYRLQLDSEGGYSDQRVISKISKMDENNQ